MRTINESFADGPLSFTPQELIDFEHTIKDSIAEFLPFTSYSLFFPKGHNGDVPEPEYRAEDKELILPLVFRGKMLCYFIAKGVTLAAPSSAPAYIMLLATSVLERLALYKKSVTDPLTGLFSRDFFLEELGKAIDQVQGCIENGSCQAGIEGKDADLSFSGTLGVIFLDLDNFQTINERYGYLSGDTILTEIGKLLALVCPKYTTVSRFANDKFAIMVPNAKPRACFQLSEVIRSGIAKLSFNDEITKDTITVTGSLGFSNYPQGLEGNQFRRTVSEQSRMLVHKARKGMTVAKAQGRNRVFGYADILSKGGRIIKTLPMNRMVVSLGETCGAKVGQRFLIRAPKGGAMSANLSEDERISGRYPAIYKGEVVLVEVQDEIAFAEVLHLGDASTVMEPGDRLRLIVGDDDSLFSETKKSGDDTVKTDAATKLFSYNDFVANFATARQAPESFGLALIRLLDQPSDGDDSYQEAMDQMVTDVAGLARGELGDSSFGGRFGLNGMIFFMEDVDAKILREKILRIERVAQKNYGLKVSVGSATYPFLNFERSDVLENSRKALEHAMLLPEPRIAVFDSISLNLSADRRFMDGDVYGAIEEFKLALLDDKNNLLARNSLGICHAQLGKFEEARQQFEKVIAIDSKDIQALYNLGWANHRLGDLKQAEQAYRQCLEVDPEHAFSLMRLASLEEKTGQHDKAAALYKEASDLPGSERMVLRPLARVSYKLGDIEATREYLHLALNADHNDHQAMHMLAKLYLDQGEDPQIAEVLARQSSALSPGKDAYWDVLVEALEAQGKAEEAAKVAARAG